MLKVASLKALWSFLEVIFSNDYRVEIIESSLSELVSRQERLIRKPAYLHSNRFSPHHKTQLNW